MIRQSSPSAYDDDIRPISIQQRRSKRSLNQLRQSLNSLQHLQLQQQLRTQQSQEVDNSLLPDDNTECLRFYKGLASRDRKQAAVTTTMQIVSCGSSPTEAAASQRSRRKRSIRRLQRLRPRLLGSTRRRSSSPPLTTVHEEAADARHNSRLRSKASGYEQSPGAPINSNSVENIVKTSTLDSNSDSCDSLAQQPAPKNSKIDTSGPNKIRYIFTKGRMQAVEVMKWPTMDRIAPSDRYRLAEPMKSVYGRRSVFRRLFKAFEKSKCYMESIDPSEIRGPIPILPRRLAESTRNRLLLWYQPLESRGEFQSSTA
ncbi:hypothetical protein BOX15_Mlig013104g2 [Macrostomum lignano]|uniref:Uncharacterized protein n=2 Tax=Macrostomum lignano TaxID=282301 RepID=A0A1I8I3Z3_9PLAT|nr:hypothetical protein BOX15_Mlig013104g2 [Macrostomum lignano]